MVLGGESRNPYSKGNGGARSWGDKKTLCSHHEPTFRDRKDSLPARSGEKHQGYPGGILLKGNEQERGRLRRCSLPGGKGTVFSEEKLSLLGSHAREG